MKTTITHQAIFCGSNTLYIVDGDQNLIEIQGESTPLIKDILQGIKENLTPKTIFEQHKELFEHDQEVFHELWNWMLEKQIIQKENAGRSIKIHLTIDLSSSDQIQPIIDSLNEISLGTFCYVYEEKIDESDIILYIGSLFPHRERVDRLAQQSYHLNIPLLYAEIDRNTFTIGPMIYSEVNSPCLNCFASRKQVQLKNPQAFKRLATNQDRESIYSPVLKSKIYYPAFVNFLHQEMMSFFISDRTYSTLIGQSVLVNPRNWEIQKLKILKVPHCNICSHQNQSILFNS
ncbi:TOMM precursor leader peptide-binding protein [Aquirufa rosea]|uniref:TOMM leader peptide-binding protein n=1 Tax=Aquirufa rosea TaxID=2509241 RepID=A0A4Q1C095_9BACT|nr:TOMM precursor leader peptide-binding protein [Aquirufa rosea]RXK49830.1 hypothetical protein ESB04_06560 [Aquirufa rosea]